MGQGSLVTEMIDAGAKLAEAFAAHYKPLQAVAWLKGGEGGAWYLYLISDQIDDANRPEAYGEVIRLLGPGSHIWLDPFQVKVRGVEEPLSRDLLKLQQGFPHLFPMRLPTRMLGGQYFEDGYLYLVPVTVAN